MTFGNMKKRCLVLPGLLAVGGLTAGLVWAHALWQDKQEELRRRYHPSLHPIYEDKEFKLIARTPKHDFFFQMPRHANGAVYVASAYKSATGSVSTITYNREDRNWTCDMSRLKAKEVIDDPNDIYCFYDTDGKLAGFKQYLEWRKAHKAAGGDLGEDTLTQFFKLFFFFDPYENVERPFVTPPSLDGIGRASEVFGLKE